MIGWIGPVFWPYAYSDLVDYAYFPYAYDAFWPYAYDDVYESIYGPYAYGYGSESSSGATGSVRRSGEPAAGAAEVCSVQATQLTDWPAERIAQAVQPDDNQQARLDDLKDATTKAIDVLQAACPTDLPSTPTGRLEAMRARLAAMRDAVQIVRPALTAFYQSLSDEQKERFNVVDEDSQSAKAQPNGRQPDLAKVCSGQTAAGARAPVARIEQALHPTKAQRDALGNLDAASQKAADILKASCTPEASLTPPGRLAAMERRLDAMLKAMDTVQPALEAFYKSLTDEQKAAFNRLDRQQG